MPVLNFENIEIALSMLPITNLVQMIDISTKRVSEFQR